MSVREKSLPTPAEGLQRSSPMRLSEHHGHNSEIPEKPVQQGLRLDAQARCQHDPSLRKGWSADPEGVRRPELADQLFVAGLLKGDRNDDRGVEDHTPFGP